MSSLLQQQLKLKERFDELGLDFDDEPLYEQKHPYKLTKNYLNKALKQALLVFPKPPKVIRDPNATRTSQRLKDNRKAKLEKRRLSLIAILDIVFKERKKFVERAEKESKAKDGYYDQTVDSITGATAFEGYPDYYVSCVAGLDLPQARDAEEEHIFTYRSGKKIFNSRGLIIGELKAGESRSLIGNEFELASISSAQIALRDLAQYCSAYFARYPEEKSVIAVGSSGGFWTWCNILREQAPKWDMKESCAIMDTPTKNAWLSLFEDYYYLGTKKSDAALEKIRALCIIKINETPPLPTHLQLVIDNDGDDDDDEDEDDDNDDDEDEDDGDLDGDEDGVLDENDAEKTAMQKYLLDLLNELQGKDSEDDDEEIDDMFADLLQPLDNSVDEANNPDDESMRVKT
ncbi:hypothetical protein BYT27DRAFT_7143561 [Phlegmacium glaucopus]|nr:hypothetical protein BYT27DRAFT_7143561 [Phlegmacium glaucopus]